MAVRGSAVHMNHNPTLYITELSPIFHNGCSSWTYLGKYNTKRIEIKLATYIYVNEMKYRRQEP